MFLSSCRLAGITVCLAFLPPGSTWAQSAPEPAPSPPPADVSAEDLADIEKALGQEAAEAARTSGTTPPPPSASPTSSSGILLSPSNINFRGLELSFILDAAAAAFTAEKPLQSGGHDPTANGFNLQQLELSVHTAVDPYFQFTGNIVFSQFGVEVEEAYASTSALPGSLQLRAGQFLTRFGRLNPTHPHSWDFVDQPFALGRMFGGEGNRGLGVEGSWLTPLPWYVEVIGSVTDASGESTARSFLGSGGGGVSSPLDFQFTGAVKQFFPLSDDLSLIWGLSAADGPTPSGYRNRADVFGTDVYLKYRPLSGGSTTIVTLQGELFYRRRQVPQDVLSDVNGYAQALWRFSQRWALAARYEFGSPARGLGGAVADDPLDPEWTDSRERLSANVTFWPTEFSRLRLQAATDNARWREQRDSSVFLALEVVMGAHGAHAF
ncbi:zinc-regulated TonB-dependent outer membrane receptor [Archangium primigenium]|uniref:zinc-regulated TonB-dependent outer membrane receptor n=1 Tax=[Archangium] primigenium TaxID=2792470 RepID=UPI0019582AB4|nr:zinc-regulated TonB-dependent outer membrane receptor [Archangium primigenium]